MGKKWQVVGLFLLIIFEWSFGQDQQQAYLDYMEQYRYVAIDEMKRGGIPASIKLAQGLLESNAGRSRLCQRSNNHFGIKCGNNWSGPAVGFKDDDYKEGQLIESCFRSYDDAMESYIDHTDFLRNKNKYSRYGFLFTLDPFDYKAWAYGLKDAGYATDPNYPTNLIAIIERYELYKYDYEGAVGPPSVYIGGIKAFKPLYNNKNLESTQVVGVYLVNDVKVFVCDRLTTVAEIASKYGLESEDLLEFNEGIKDAYQRLEEGDRVFLQRKRSFNHNRDLWHYVKDNETMYSISQTYGVKLDKLYSKNRMEQGTEPATGERIKLRWKIGKDEIPKLRSEVKTLLPAQPLVTNPDLELDQDIAAPIVMPAKPKVNSKIPNTSANSEGVKKQKANIVKSKMDKTPKNSIQTNSPIVKQPSAIPPAEKIPEIKMIPANKEVQAHEVIPGDTLYNLGKKYGLKLNQIIEMNNLQGDSIKIGQKLIIKQ